MIKKSNKWFLKKRRLFNIYENDVWKILVSKKELYGKNQIFQWI